jgi:hypothetical protein
MAGMRAGSCKKKVSSQISTPMLINTAKGLMPKHGWKCDYRNTISKVRWNATSEALLMLTGTDEPATLAILRANASQQLSNGSWASAAASRERDAMPKAGGSAVGSQSREHRKAWACTVVYASRKHKSSDMMGGCLEDEPRGRACKE